MLQMDTYSPESSMRIERILVGVLFLSGWDMALGLLHQYHYVADPMTWAEAQTYCRKAYTDLATIENAEEMNQLITTVSSFGDNSDVWIGLYSEIKWKWSDDYHGTGAEYRNWQSHTDNEPDFYSANQFCVTVDHIGGWWDRECHEDFPFICYRGTQLDPEFVVMNETMDWSSAQRYCRENYRDLATVTSDTQNQVIQKLVLNKGETWIGLFRDPHIYWTDGSDSSFRHWGSGSMPFGSMSVTCGVAAVQKSGKWWAESCTKKLPFVCYSVPPAPVMRQVVKVRVKRGGSSVDLNNPDVKEQILRQLQDRLTEEGVSGVTLKWREQPDGKVFHKEGGSSPKKERVKTEL